MVLQCLAWIPHLWAQLVGPFIIHKKGVVRPLPDDVIINILSRLPADFVLICRRVCRQWQILTSTPYFAELHLKRVTPELFVQVVDFKHMYHHDLDLFVFTEAKKDTRITKIHASSTHPMKNHWPLLIGSCNGLLLFQSSSGESRSSMLFVFNPITQEQITLMAPAYPGYLCGIFFHPLAREYKLLYAHCQRNSFQYFTRTLGAKRWRLLSSFPFLPVYSAPAAIVNGSLHWMVEQKCRNEFDIAPCKDAIMVFSMDGEDFHAMPHPGNECHSIQRHEKMHLLEMKEHSSLCFLFMHGKQIDVWMLEDYANWAWVRRYKVNLDWDVKRYPFEWVFTNYEMKLLSIQHGELLLVWYLRGLFWYHLELNTVREIKRKGWKIREYKYYYCRTTAYTKSLVTLSGIPADV